MNLTRVMQLSLLKSKVAEYQEMSEHNMFYVLDQPFQSMCVMTLRKWSCALFFFFFFFFLWCSCSKRAFAISGGSFIAHIESTWVCRWQTLWLSCTKYQMLQNHVATGTPLPFEENSVFMLTVGVKAGRFWTGFSSFSTDLIAERTRSTTALVQLSPF